MNDIQGKIIKFANLKRKSINHCLVVLGAKRNEVYFTDAKTGRDNSNRINIGKPCKASRHSVYDNLSKPELLDWVKHLYKESLKKYHPDLHPENPRLYTEICQELGKAYLQAVKILT